MKNLGAAIAGGGGIRRANDFYPTPPEAVEALLLSSWRPAREFPVWEPACGDGAIAKVLRAEFFNVVATDLVDRGYGVGDVDFMAAPVRMAPQIVTNPPFKLAEQFIRRGFSLGVGYQAHLLKAQFWNAASRLSFFRSHPPAAVLPLTWRLDFTGGGAPTMDCSWVVWMGWEGATVFEPLARPLDPFAA